MASTTERSGAKVTAGVQSFAISVASWNKSEELIYEATGT